MILALLVASLALLTLWLELRHLEVETVHSEELERLTRRQQAADRHAQYLLRQRSELVKLELENVE